MKNLIINNTALLLLVLTVGCSNPSKKAAVKNSSTSTSAVSAAEAENRLSKLPESLRNSDLFSTSIFEPTKLLDNAYFVGYVGVGVFIIETSEGLVLIDAMWTPNDAESVIVPGIKKLGLDPGNIKYLIITHEHSDHYGGARYFEDNYDIEILMTKIAWEHMVDPKAEVLTDPFGNYSSEIALPTSYTEIKDGQKISLGNTTITVLSTPGHSLGGISLIIQVTDNGVPHMAAIWGGTGLPKDLEGNEVYLKSLNYFESVANAENVDIEISNHPFSNHLLEKMEALKTRKPGEPNPVVIGNEEFKQYVDSSLRKKVVTKISSFKKK